MGDAFGGGGDDVSVLSFNMCSVRVEDCGVWAVFVKSFASGWCSLLEAIMPLSVIFVLAVVGGKRAAGTVDD